MNSVYKDETMGSVDADDDDLPSKVNSVGRPEGLRPLNARRPSTAQTSSKGERSMHDQGERHVFDRVLVRGGTRPAGGGHHGRATVRAALGAVGDPAPCALSL